jgi:hypothetical protein
MGWCRWPGTWGDEWVQVLAVLGRRGDVRRERFSKAEVKLKLYLTRIGGDRVLGDVNVRTRGLAVFLQ